VYWPGAQPSPAAWIAIISMGIASTGFAYILYFRLISNVGPAKAITVAYLIPVFAMLWGVLLLRETVSSHMIIGCGIIFAGTALVSGVFRRNRVAAGS
ncbi:MAG: DMT family transporter, partial [Gammaproteobacteria bacterium]|nr:DMT family transporter [Gammaproteobacteria bacterium]